MPVPPWPYQLSWHGWIRVDFNQNIWLPCPMVFPDGSDRASWAKLYAEEWWSRTARPYGKREIRKPGPAASATRLRSPLSRIPQ
jgi:hypothetical protein